ncbi:MAG: MotA/TolQ/ExbB proton channel family protein [Planctomycetaceae bacterium]
MRTLGRRWIVRTGLLAIALLTAPSLLAADTEPLLTDNGVNVGGLLRAGGVIGYIILALSVAMVALIVEHLLSIRRGSLMPPGMADEARQTVEGGQLQQALQLCRSRPSFLGHVVAAGLQEAAIGPEAIEKGMEDAAAEQAARLMRKIEYLSVIGTLAPMLGLMGTVWGMIQAFGEFAEKANPQVAEFAPGISNALVTTLMGLCVAVPALAFFAIFRNRIDEFVAEASLQAEHVLAPVRRAVRQKRDRTRDGRPGVSDPQPERQPPPPVVRERDA